jgi:hypothetical protein
MMSMCLAIASLVTPPAPPALAVTKLRYNDTFVGVDLRDKVEGRDYVRTGETMRIAEGFGDAGGTEVTVVRMMR